MNNAQRAIRFAQGLESAYPESQFDTPVSSSHIALILSDARHYCVANGVDFDAADRLAVMHFEAEQDDLEDNGQEA